MRAELLQLISAARYPAAFIFICFLPGLALSYLLFPPQRLDFLERLFVACSSSVALSSLLAAWLLLLPVQFIPMIYSAGLLLLSAIFSGLALWRSHRSANGNDPLSLSFPTGKRKFTKPVLLVAVVSLGILFFLPALNWNKEFLSVDDKLTTSYSDITEFFIYPQEVETVLESVKNPREETVIPLVIVNHNPEPVEYRIEIFEDDQHLIEQSGIIVSSGDTWYGNVTKSLLKSNQSTYFDILLYTNASPDSVARLRLWY